MWVGRWALVYAQSRTFLGQLASQIFDPSMETSQLSWNKSPLLQLVLLQGWPVVELLVKVVVAFQRLPYLTCAGKIVFVVRSSNPRCSCTHYNICAHGRS